MYNLCGISKYIYDEYGGLQLKKMVVFIAFHYRDFDYLIVSRYQNKVLGWMIVHFSGAIFKADCERPNDYITHLRKYVVLFGNITVDLDEDNMRYLVMLYN